MAADERLVGIVRGILLTIGATVCVALVHCAATAHEAAARPLRFGIYPTAGVGTVNPIAATTPENELARWDALKRLRGSRSRSFVLRLYTSWDGHTRFKR